MSYLMSDESLGSEMIYNGDFTLDASGWGVGANWSIGGGTANFDASGNSGLQQANSTMLGTIEDNKTYRWEFDVSIVSGTASIRLYDQGYSVIYAPVDDYAHGHHAVDFNSGTGGASGVVVFARSASSNPFSIDNVSIKEVIPPKRLMSDESLGADLISNGDFSSGGTDWSGVTDFTFVSGIARYGNNQLGRIIQTSAVLGYQFTAGERMSIEFDVSAAGIGRMQFQDQGNNVYLLAANYSPGHHVVEGIAPSTVSAGDFMIRAYTNGEFDLDNVVVKKVIQPKYLKI